MLVLNIFISGEFLARVYFNLQIILIVSSELLDHKIYILENLVINSNNLTITLVLELKCYDYLDNDPKQKGILSEYSINKNG